MAISYVCNSLANLFNSFASPVAITAIGWKYYIVYIVLLGQFLVVAYFFFPETRGHSLEQISDIFERKGTIGRNSARITSALEDGKSGEALQFGVAKHLEEVSIEGKSDVE
jgi:H+/Cl- antiporter ClcA